MDGYGFYTIIDGQPHEGNRLLIECALQAAGDSAVRDRSFTLRGEQLKTFFVEVRERCSRSPLSDSEIGLWLAEHIGWWEESAIAIDFLPRENGSGSICPHYESDAQVPTSFPESVTRSPDAGWDPSDPPAPGTRLP